MAHLTALPNTALPVHLPAKDTGSKDQSSKDQSNQEQCRVMAADSTAMSTQLLVDALGRDAQFQMIEAPSSGAAVLQLAKREKPQVVVLSAKVGESNAGGFELVRELRALSPSPRVIVLLDTSDRTAVIEAFRAGAQGVFCRTEPFRLLSKCIQCVHAGQVWASSSQLQFVLEALAKPTLANFTRNGESLLSAREMDVVRCVAEGLSNREIAQRLTLTEHTIKNYLFRIFDKLGVSSRVEVVLYALGNSAPHPQASPVTPVASANARPVAVPSKPAGSSVPIRKTAT
jgi:two-component system nitrate/nitrite response regulator NarL